VDSLVLDFLINKKIIWGYPPIFTYSIPPRRKLSLVMVYWCENLNPLDSISNQFQEYKTTPNLNERTWKHGMLRLVLAWAPRVKRRLKLGWRVFGALCVGVLSPCGWGWNVEPSQFVQRVLLIFKHTFKSFSEAVLIFLEPIPSTSSLSLIQIKTGKIKICFGISGVLRPFKLCKFLYRVSENSYSLWKSKLKCLVN